MFLKLTSFSIIDDTFSSDSSHNLSLVNCKPIGRLDFDVEKGIDIEGRPARFAGIVKISERYILNRLFFFSPNLNGNSGEVGDNIQSTLLNAFIKSF